MFFRDILFDHFSKFCLYREILAGTKLSEGIQLIHGFSDPHGQNAQTFNVHSSSARKYIVFVSKFKLKIKEIRRSWTYRMICIVLVYFLLI